MSSTFTLGVTIAGAVSGIFYPAFGHSAFGDTQRTINALRNSTDRLKQTQTRLTSATERYGSISSQVKNRLQSNLAAVSHSMSRLERQQNRLAKWDGISKGLAAQRGNITRELMNFATSTVLAAPVVMAAGTARKTMDKGEVMSSMRSWLESIDRRKLSARYATFFSQPPHKFAPQKRRLTSVS